MSALERRRSAPTGILLRCSMAHLHGNALGRFQQGPHHRFDSHVSELLAIEDALRCKLHSPNQAVTAALSTEGRSRACAPPVGSQISCIKSLRWSLRPARSFNMSGAASQLGTLSTLQRCFCR